MVLFVTMCSRVVVDGIGYQNGYTALKEHVVCGFDRDDDVGMHATGTANLFQNGTLSYVV